MSHTVVFTMVLVAYSGCAFAGEGAIPAVPTGTPRALTAEESANVEAFLKRNHGYTAAAFGEQMGFGMRRIEPLVYFHFLSGHARGWMQIELLGVVNHREPVVYKNPLPTAKGAEALRQETFHDNKKVTPPKKQQFDDAETRPLLPAEQLALKTLNTGANLYWEQTGAELRAVGALRAEKSCTECHAVKEGALLGALTYTWKTDAVLQAIKNEAQSQGRKMLRSDRQE